MARARGSEEENYSQRADNQRQRGKITSPYFSRHITAREVNQSLGTALRHEDTEESRTLPKLSGRRADENEGERTLRSVICLIREITRSTTALVIELH